MPFFAVRAALTGALLSVASLGGAAGYDWQNVAMGGGGFVSGIITSKTVPGLIYARTDVGGAYRWDGPNGRWRSLTDWVSDNETGLLGIESIAIDPSTPDNIYMLAGISYQNGGRSAVLRSRDGGRSFSKVDVTAQFKVNGNGMGRNAGEKLQVDPADGNIVYAGTRANGLFKSTDAGVTWRHLPASPVTTTSNGNGISFVVLAPADGPPTQSATSHASRTPTQTLYLGVSRFGASGPNLYVSHDAGQTIKPLTGGPADLMPQRAVLAGGKLIITYANGAGPWGDASRGAETMDRGQVWPVDLATGAWTNISPPLNRAYAGITVDPRKPERMMVSTINYYQPGRPFGDKLFLTNDGGASWTDIFARGYQIDTNGISWFKGSTTHGSSIHWAGSVEFDPFDSKTVMVVSGNGTFRTTDIDATPAAWTFNVHGLEEMVPLGLVSVPGGPLISVIGDYDGFLHTNVNDYGPIHSPPIGTTTGLDVAAADTRKVVRVGSTMFLSEDTGKTWRATASQRGKKGQVALNADGSVIIHSPEGTRTSYVSRDLGNTWNPVAGLSAPNARAVADPIDPHRFYALSGADFMVSTDAGASFSTTFGFDTAKGSPLIRAMPGRSGDIWVALYQGGLMHSTDGGKSFAALPAVTHASAVGFGKALAGLANPSIFLWGTVGGTRGMYCSTDTGATWARINDDAHQYGGPGNGQFVVGDMNTAGVVYMSTAGRGIVVGKPSSGAAPCQKI